MVNGVWVWDAGGVQAATIMLMAELAASTIELGDYDGWLCAFNSSERAQGVEDQSSER